MISTQLKNIVKMWPSLSKTLSVPHTKREYNKLCKYLDELLDEVGNNESHELASLMETVGLLVAEYEKQYYPMTDARGIDALKFLMKEHGLKQVDLKEIGSQGVVSEILHGKRELNIRQVKILAKKFSISPTVFI